VRRILKNLTILLILGGLFHLSMGTPVFCQTKPSRAGKNTAVYQLIQKDYTVNPDGSYTLMTHVIIDILSYKGKKDHADFRYPYNNAFQSVEIVEAHTLTANGESVPVTKKEIHDINAPEDARATLFSRRRIKVVNFPSVEPGTKVEIKLKLQSKKGFWTMECFRLPDPIKRKIVRVTLPAGTPLNIKLPRLKLKKSEKEKGKTVTYQWEAWNVPRRVQEPNLPPIENRGTCLFLSTLPSWKDAAQFFAASLPTSGLSEGVRSFKEKTPEDLYVTLMKHLISYPIDYFHTSLTFQTPEETLKKGYGSSIDLAILFYNLLKKRGFSPSYLMANTGLILLEPFKEISYPPLFDDVMVRCEGKDYAFYVKDLPPGYTGLQGKLTLDLTEGTLVPSKVHYPNQATSRLYLTPTGTFDLEGRFTAKREGRQAVETRSWLRYKTKDEWRIAALQILHDIDPLAQSLGEISRKGLNTLTAPVVLAGKFKIPALFPRNGRFMYVHLAKPELPIRLENLSDKRRGPLMVGQMFTDVAETRVALPAGMRVRYAPKASSGTSKVMDWSLKIDVRENSFTFHRTIHLKRGILHPGTKEYHDLLKAIHLLYAPTNRIVILERK